MVLEFIFVLLIGIVIGGMIERMICRDDGVIHPRPPTKPPKVSAPLPPPSSSDKE